jgi:hypothetical protein
LVKKLMIMKLKAGALIFISRGPQPIDFIRDCQVGYPKLYK